MTCLSLCLTLLVASVPPLAETDQRQLADVADDTGRFDAGPLYPLLRNVMQWDPPVSSAGARIPDYAALEKTPGAHRGEMFVIEGIFGNAGRFALSRSGPWGEALTQWGVKIPAEKLPGDEPRFVAVFFVDPKNSMTKPLVGTEVRIVGRFYKLWRTDTGGEGEQKRTETFPTFIARSAEVTGGTQLSSRPSLTFVAIVLGVLLVVFGYFFRRARRLSKAEPAAPRRNAPRAGTPARRDEADAADAGDEEDDEAPLPQDAPDALDELARRHQQSE